MATHFGMMESEEIKHPQLDTNTMYEQTSMEDIASSLHCEITPNSTIEQLDVKTEPPDLMDASEAPNGDINVLDKDSAISSLRIDTVESKVSYETEMKSLGICIDNNVVDVPESLEEPTVLIKQEMDSIDVFAPVVSISYDIPKAEEAKVGEDLRRSLQEEIVLKVEVEDDSFEGECAKVENSEAIQIKTELPTTHSNTTENHITDSMIDASSVGALLNECHSIKDVKKIRLSSQSAPDQMTQLHVYNSDFQLNSITGDMLSLEQEAYGLLKAKNKTKVITHPYVCSKCPKSCSNKNLFLRHMKVHETIERRAQGVQQGIRTKRLNLEKKELDLMKIGTSKDTNLSPYYYKRQEARKGQFKCKICGKQYRLLRCLRRHQRECMEAKQKVELIKPPAGLRKEVRQLRATKGEKVDAKSEKGEYKCECGKTFSRRSRLETCLRSHHPEVESRSYSCTTCAKSFKEKSELILHRKRQHVKKKFLCKFCPMDYHTQKELFDHLRVHKKVQLMEYKVISAVVEGKQVLRCFICNKTSAELSELKAHVLVDHKEPYTCPLCKENFPKIVDFATHTKSAHPEVEGQSVLNVLEAFSILAEAWKCEECHVQFEDPDDLVKHQTEQHGPVNKKHIESGDESSKFQFRCEDCRRTFSTLKQLTTHRDLHHTVKDPNQSEKEEISVPERILTPPPPRPMCVHCRKVCNDEAALTSHLRLHSMERKYPCKYCDFRFGTLEKKRTHLAIHTGDMKFVCFICEYRCTSENRLNFHKQTSKHLDLKEALLKGPPLEPQAPMVQPEIKKKRLSSERKKSKGSDVPATCDICGEEFPSEDLMMKHKDTHPFIVFPNEEKPTRIFFK